MIRLKLGGLSCQAFPPTFIYRSLVWILNVNNITEFILEMEQKSYDQAYMYVTGMTYKIYSVRV